MSTLLQIGLFLIFLLVFFFLKAPSFFYKSAVVETKGKFKGESEWRSDPLRQCEVPRNEYYKQHDLGCHTYLMKDSFETIRMELISRDPILIVFKRLADNSQIEEFLREVSQLELGEQAVQNEQGQSETSLFRQANGTWIFHEEFPGIATVFKKVQKVLKNVNFAVAEHWSVLSYHPGGHYAPHYDMLDEPKKEIPEDSWMKLYGNRWATFLLVLKTADVGGGTVFPKIKTTVLPEAGDAMFWTNMNTDKSKSLKSKHGACPIVEGRKIAATLWIREKNQPVLDSSHGEPLFDPTAFLEPSTFSAECSA